MVRQRDAIRVGRVGGRAAILATALLGMVASGCSDDKGTPDDSSAPPPAAVASGEASGAAAGTSPPPAAAPDGARITAVIAGTSLTAGLGLDPEEAYPAVLQRMADSAGLPVRVVNAGLSGETSAGLLRRVEWLMQQPADLVVIETGANDGLRGFDVDSTKANLGRIVRAVQQAQPAARIALVQMEAPPNLGPDYTARFRAMYPEVAAETGVELFPFLLEGVAGVRALNQSDGIHPSAAGARLVAATLWPGFAGAVRAVEAEAPGG